MLNEFKLAASLRGTGHRQISGNASSVPCLRNTSV